MNDNDGNWVPKVHPATRPVEPEDPMLVVANMVEGDVEQMLECLVQEYAWMGWTVDQIMELFGHPFYPMLNGLLEQFGRRELQYRVEAIAARTGVFRFHEVVVEEEPDEETQLVQITLLHDEKPAMGRSPLGYGLTGEANDSVQVLRRQ